MEKIRDIRKLFEKLLKNAPLSSKLWDGARFEKIRTMEIDERDEFGGQFIARCLRRLGKEVNHNNSTGDDKDWDLTVLPDDIYLKVITASLETNNTFQHENLGMSGLYDGVVFLDVSPDNVFIRFVAKISVPWRKIHRRKNGTFYKWDWKLQEAHNFEVLDLGEFKVSYEKMVVEIKKNQRKQKSKSKH